MGNKRLRKTAKKKRLTLQDRYGQFFSPNVRTADDDNLSLEQPSPLRLVPSETTYSVPINLNPMPDA